MRVFSFFASLVLLLTAPRVMAQGDLDLASVTADPIKLIFSDDRTTVASYVYRTLEARSACCGSDAVYLEVKIDAEGKTSSVRALLSRNDCYRRSVADIIKDIRWTKTNLGAAGKTIFFELKPVLPCRGVAGENVYKPLGSAADAVAAAQAAKIAEEAAARAEAARAAPAQPAATEPTPAPSTPVVVERPKAAVVQPKATEVKSEVKTAETKPAPAALVEVKPTPAPKPTPTPAPVASAEPKTTPAKPQEPVDPGVAGTGLALGKPAYAAGDRQPDASHAQSHANGAGPLLAAPEYVDGEALQALFLKQELRKAGVCGLVHVLAELTVAPQPKGADGKDQPAQVVAYRIFRANSKDVLDKLPAILQSLRYKPESVRFRQNIYLEFKADVDCGTNSAQTNLGNVRDYLKNPEKPQ